MRSQFESVEAAGIDTDELWRHLLGCALLMEAQTPGEPVATQAAFTAGLLHDLGRMSMAAQAPSRYRLVVEAAQGGADACAMERRAFGIDHAEFGRSIAERWRLTPEVIEASGGHHDPVGESGATESPLLQRLRIARQVVSELGIGDGVGRPAARTVGTDEHPFLTGLGGRAAFMSSIRWFRDSTTTRGRAAA